MMKFYYSAAFTKFSHYVNSHFMAATLDLTSFLHWPFWGLTLLQ